MDTTQLETFLTIVKHLNYSKAADILSVTQPTITARIKNLEVELNCQLFHRDGKTLSVSNEGKLFVDYATKILALQKDSLEAIKQLQNPTMKIGFCPGFSSSFILETMGVLKSDQSLKFLITEGEDSTHLIEQVLTGELDLIFTRNHVTHGAELISEHLFDDRFVLIVGKEHRLARMGTVTLDDLHEETLICYRQEHPIWSVIDQALIGVKNLKRIEVRSQEMLKNLVKNEWGISFSPTLGIDPHERIIGKEIPEISHLPNKVYVVYRKNSLIEKHIKQMVYAFVNYEVENNQSQTM